jgi:hypothetical protein
MHGGSLASTILRDTNSYMWLENRDDWWDGRWRFGWRDFMASRYGSGMATLYDKSMRVRR